MINKKNIPDEYEFFVGGDNNMPKYSYLAN